MQSSDVRCERASALRTLRALASSELEIVPEAAMKPHSGNRLAPRTPGVTETWRRYSYFGAHSDADSRGTDC